MPRTVQELFFFWKNKGKNMLTRYNLVFSGGQVIAKWENMVAKSDEVAVGWDRRILACQM